MHKSFVKGQDGGLQYPIFYETNRLDKNIAKDLKEYPLNQDSLLKSD